MKASILLSRVTCTIFACLIIALGVLTFAMPREEYSEEENRYLSTPPVFSVESVFSGGYTEDVASFICDHVPFRLTLLRGKCESERLLGRAENNHVLFGKDGYLIKRLEWRENETFRESISGAMNLVRTLEGHGVSTSLLCAPRAIDSLACYLPEGYPQNGTKALTAFLGEHAEGALFPAALLAERAATGEQVFFRTDHHWTPLGAYYIYEILGEEMGYSPLSLSGFDVEIATESFVGTSASAALAREVTPDRIVRYRYRGDDTLTVTDMTTGEVKKGLYRDEFLDKKDKYACFLGGNFAHLRITGEGDRPRLLLIKDSYANCLVPFLARHYDLDLVDLRYVRGDAPTFLDAILSSTPFDRALLLFNIQSLSEGVGLAPFA